MISNSTAGLIFYGLALLAFLWLTSLLRRVRTVQAWPVVIGTIVDSSVESDADSNSYPRVRYQYSFNGARLHSDRILPHGEFASTGNYAAKVVARYPVGRKVKVYVNPTRPTDAALELTLPMLVPAMLIAAVIAFWFLGSLLRP